MRKNYNNLRQNDKNWRRKMKTMKMPDFDKMFQNSGVYDRNTSTDRVSA